LSLGQSAFASHGICAAMKKDKKIMLQAHDKKIVYEIQKK
jgi:hypothetical protein